MSPDQRLGEKSRYRRARERHIVPSVDRRRSAVLKFFGVCMRAARGALAQVGVYKAMAQRATRIAVIENEIESPSLSGLRILHLSDLHIDSFSEFGQKIADLISGLRYDIAVVTGDFRFTMRGSMRPVLEGMAPVCKLIKNAELGAYAVLGNHDSLDLVPALEEMGLRVLLNEHVELDYDGVPLTVLGVDDTYYFHTADLNRALRGAPPGFKLLLSHTPDLLERASSAGVDLYLCGHTHGGQLCLPGGVPIMINSWAAREYLAGAWRVDNMNGYTSKGVGFSNLPIRTFCPAEIIVHVLRA